MPSSPPASSSPSASKNNVAIQARAGAFESDEHGEIRGQHAFIVDRAAAVDVAVFDHAAEGIDGPFRFIHADDIEMGHQNQCARRIGKRAGIETRDEKAAARRAFENFERNIFLLQHAADIFCGDELVARRIGGVDANQILQPDERLVGDVRNVGRWRSWRSGGLRRRSCWPARALPALRALPRKGTRLLPSENCGTSPPPKDRTSEQIERERSHRSTGPSAPDGHRGGACPAQQLTIR